MKPFVVNRYGQIVFPFNFIPELDFSVFETLEQFAAVIPWLIVNRNGLTVFAHAETGNALEDHIEHVLWLGTSEPLNLAALSR